LKRHVSFSEFNLFQDDVAQLVALGGSFDLILCRNVFIYFTPEAIAQTLRRFYQALKPGGYLVTGHAELQGIPLNGLQVRCFPESIVYQRPVRSRPTVMGVTTLRQTDYTAPAQPWRGEDTPALRSREPAPQLSTTSASRLRSLSQSLSVARTTTQNNINPGGVPALGRWLNATPQGGAHPAPTDDVSQAFMEIMQRAKQDANQGNYVQARHGCQEAIALQPFAVEPCYLLASIAEESNDLDGAKVFLKRVIYLDEMAIPAYLELAALYDRTGEGDRATKTRRSVVRILAKLPPHRALAACDNMTVTELQTLVSRQIEEQT
ncbi:MAG: CheR family methyltransferase, partial [Leptolyngbyaceae bacterium]|nr:CheR family methyltransferase [Leptolyngbyaceae bacterium]